MRYVSFLSRAGRFGLILLVALSLAPSLWAQATKPNDKALEKPHCLCGGHWPNACEICPGLATDRTENPLCVANGANCGLIDDGHGGHADCGTCTGVRTCGGGGIPNVCSCTPKQCDGTTCGLIDQDCGLGPKDCVGECSEGLLCVLLPPGRVHSCQAPCECGKPGHCEPVCPCGGCPPCGICDSVKPPASPSKL